MKRMNAEDHHYFEHVAPHAGAWIETRVSCLADRLVKSPPMRGRGLKPLFVIVYVVHYGSPPMRGRGLKPRDCHAGTPVASRPPCGGVD